MLYIVCCILYIVFRIVYLYINIYYPSHLFTYLFPYLFLYLYLLIYIASVVFFKQVINEERRVLAVYPVFLFYTFLAWMVVLQ